MSEQTQIISSKRGTVFRQIRPEPFQKVHFRGSFVLRLYKPSGSAFKKMTDLSKGTLRDVNPSWLAR